MFNFLSGFFRAKPHLIAADGAVADAIAPSQPATRDETRIGYLPELVQDLKREHRLLEASFAALVQAHQAGDVEACLDSLRIFTNTLRAHLLKENLWLYRYLDQTFRSDAAAFVCMRLLRAEMQAIGRELNAFTAEYIGSSWDAGRRRRLGADLRRIGRILAHRISTEEHRLYPLYRPGPAH